VTDEEMSVEQLWNETDRGRYSAVRNTCPSLYMDWARTWTRAPLLVVAQYQNPASRQQV